MKVIVNNDVVSKWTYAFTCACCKSILEAAVSDLRAVKVSTTSDMRGLDRDAYRREYRLNCTVCNGVYHD
jgi:hypothetical protein